MRTRNLLIILLVTPVIVHVGLPPRSVASCLDSPEANCDATHKLMMEECGRSHESANTDSQDPPQPSAPTLSTDRLETRSSAAAAQTSQENVDSLIKEVDRLYRSETSYTELEMEIVTPHWQRTLAMYGWSQGMEKTFIRITSPLKEKGVTTLRIDQEMWNYLPKTNKVMKIPPSMMMGSWMGSDFTNDDLVKESSLFEDYSYELIEPDSGDEHLLYINCIPREDLAVVWGNIVIAVGRSDHLPVWQKYYDEKGKLMRVMMYSETKELGGRMIPSVLEMVPTTKEGHKTIIRYLKAEFNVRLDDDTFTLRNLRSSD